MHGAGNDYIYVDTTRYPIENPEKLSKKWSAPHTGIGSDGLVLIGRSDKADFSMRIFNADGSEAKMCGNASRCIGKYLYDYKLTSIEIDGIRYTGTTVSMGNPHLVIFVNDITKVDLSSIGPKLENHPLFPDRTNVEFAQVLEEGKIRMRVWERGSGVTRACGTGACATAVAAFLTGRAGRKSIIGMDGGTLTIEWDIATKHVFMTGEATKVFEGEMETDEEL